jgi:YVTN family beta-propeller protein
MKKLLFSMMLLASCTLFFACDTDSVTTVQPYESGVFITHEGPFQNGSGTVSFYNRNVGGISNDIFGAANNGAVVGNILQSMSIANDNAYLVVNNANKIIVAEAKTFKFKDTLTGFTQPRYFLNIDGKKAAVSEWGKNGVAGVVKIVDLTTKKTTKTIATGNGAERMLLNSNTLWVTNVGGFGSDSTVSLIDLTTEAVSKTVKVGVAPNSLVKDANGDVWVLCGGSWSAKNGKLVKVKGNAVVESYDVPQGSNSLVANNAKNTMYFVGGAGVYQKDLTTAKPAIWIDKASTKINFVALYGLGLDPKTENIFIADAKNFASTGTVYVFNNAKKYTDSLKTGIIPSNFWFQ